MMCGAGASLLILGLALSGSIAAAEELARGVVIEKVVCAAEPAQSYALYLPSNYDASRNWPVIFCFDPRARGVTPVERLRAAAEKFGYVVAGSNNSRNGPWAANATAIQAMVRDADTRLRLDARRLYTAGLSGGARVATQAAVMGLSHGVIACSAAFPNSETPAKVPFAFFGTAGLDDFNYLELRRVDRELDERHAAHRVVIFEGSHEWAPAALMTEAVGWFELQGMRTGARPKDRALIEELWTQRLAAIPEKPALETSRALKSLAADFKDFRDTSEIEKQARELAAGREVRDQLKAERALERREEELLGRIAEQVGDGDVAAIRRTADDLRRLAEAAEDSPERRMARRVSAGFANSSRETVRALFDAGDYEHAVSLLEMTTALRPDRSQTLFDLARAHALDGDKKAALEALQRAVAAGFDGRARLEQEPAFAKLRNDPVFQKLLPK
jgi:tetratricopeptide (TPR) repeat protein